MQINWREPDLNAEKIDSKVCKGDDLILYYFTANWCGACAKFERRCWTSPEIVSLINQKFVPVKLIDKSQEERVSSPAVQSLESKYAVAVFPTLVVAMPNDEEDESGLERSPGVMDRAKTLQFLQTAVHRIAYRHAQRLLIKGNFAEAADLFGSYLKSFQKDDEWLPRAVLFRYISLRLAGKTLAAKSFVTDYLPKLTKEWPYPLLRYAKGEINYEALVKDAGDWERQRFEMHAWVGILNLADGNMTEGKRQLEKALKMKEYTSWYSYKLAHFLTEKIAKSTSNESPQ
jgi:thioredoxin-related protein